MRDTVPPAPCGSLWYNPAMSERPVRAFLIATALFLALTALLLHPLATVLFPLAGALLIAATCLAIGRLLLSLSKQPIPSAATCMAVGWIFTSGFFFAASALHRASIPALVIYLLLPIGLSALLRRGIGFWTQTYRELSAEFGEPSATWGLLLVPLVYAVLPPTFYDTLVYHLGIPNQIVRWGGFVPTPYHLYANSAIYHEIALIPAVLLGDRVPSLLHFLLGVFTLLAAIDFAREHLRLKQPKLVVVVLLSLPMTLFLLASQKNDLISALFILLAIHHWKSRTRLAALCWAFAIGVKSFNLVPLLAFFLVSQPWRKDEWKRWAQLAWIAPLVLTPLLFKNLLFMGNPFFPFLTEWLPSPSWDSVRQGHMIRDVGATVRSLADLVHLPYNLFFRSLGSGGWVGPLPLAFLPLLILTREKTNRSSLWFSLLTLLLAAPFTASSRFVYVAFLVLSLWACQAYLTVRSRWLTVAFVVLIGLGFVQGLAILEWVFPATPLLVSKGNAEGYTANRFPSYPVFAMTNALPANSRILLVGEARNYYLKRPYALSSALDRSVILPYLEHSTSATDFLARVKAAGFTHLLVNTSELSRLRMNYDNLDPWQESRFLEYCQQWKPKNQAGATSLYDIVELLGQGKK